MANHSLVRSPVLTAQSAARMKRLAHALTVVLAIAAGALLIGSPGQATTEQAVLATLVIMLGGLPMVVFLRRGQFDVIPLLPLNGLFYSATFGLPTFSGTAMAWGVDDSALTEALVLTCGGVIAMYIGYYLVGRPFRKTQPLRIHSFFDGAAFTLLGTVFVMSRFLVSSVPGLAGDSTATQAAILLSHLGVCLLSAVLVSRDVPSPWRIWAMAAMGGFLFIELVSGALARFLIVIVFMSLVFWQKRLRIPLAAVVAVVVVFAALNPIKSEYRAATWGAAGAELGILDKARIFWDVAIFHNPVQRLDDLDNAAINLDRIGHVHTFARIIESTPAVVPYWGGETLLPLLTKPIPRLLWPEKPEERLGNVFWQEYGVLQGDTTTSYNLPWLPELYANFGWLGVLVGAMLIGALFRFLVEKFRFPDQNEFRFYFGLVLFLGMFWAESNLSLMLGGLLLNFIALFAIFKLLPTFTAGPRSSLGAS